MNDALVCLAVVDNGRLTKPVGGSVITQCADCRCDVWIAPSGVDNVARNGLTVICIRCADKYVRPHTKMVVTAESLREVADELRRD